MDKADAPKWKSMTDWSDMPDVYVTKAECQQGMFWRIEACSVPMAIGPEVRLLRADRVAQQLANAEARGMERAADYLDVAEHDAQERNWNSGANAFDALSYAIRAEASALRKESAMTDMARLGQEWERDENPGTHENHVGTHEK